MYFSVPSTKTLVIPNYQCSEEWTLFTQLTWLFSTESVHFVAEGTQTSYAVRSSVQETRIQPAALQQCIWPSQLALYLQVIVLSWEESGLTTERTAITKSR